MGPLPECEYRVEIDQPNKYFCAHTQVHSAGNLVGPSICRTCRQYHVPCPEPRPLPSPEELVPAPQQPPSFGRKLWNLAKALTDFVADGLTTVSAEEYAERLAICDECPERQGNHCVKCGCRLSLKARGRAFQCPLEKWPVQGD